MSEILVSGLINIETTLRVDKFPLIYMPVRYPFFGINSTVSGVGYNIAKALTILGNNIAFLSIIGQDFAGHIVGQTLKKDEIDQNYIIKRMPQTAQSVIIFDGSGKRQIHTDLKDIQDRYYPDQHFEAALQKRVTAVLCNINFNRRFLGLVQQRNIPIATDVHTIADIDDDYNKDFMDAAQILFLSDERLPCAPHEFALELQKKYSPEIIVIGLGNQGALLAVEKRGVMQYFPAVRTRAVVNTIGAGDALFSSFLHVYLKTGDPVTAIQKSILFASYKIGESGAAEGFLTEKALWELSNGFPDLPAER